MPLAGLNETASGDSKSSMDQFGKLIIANSGNDQEVGQNSQILGNIGTVAECFQQCLECLMCSTLRAIIQQSRDEVDARRIQVGTLKNLLSTKCQLHVPMVKYVATPITEEAGNPQSDRDRVILVSHQPYSVYLGVGRTHKRFEKVTRAYSSPSDNILCSLGPWIEDDLFLRWKSACKCKPGHLGPPERHATPTHLIDVVGMCLVKSASHTPYIALSYVWGKVSVLQATLENSEQLKQPGVFSRPEIASQLPLTILHAISLTKKLQERYLWVDALCIIQDDAVHKMSEINKMASIFENADLTIIVANGKDANYGIRGLKTRGKAHPRISSPTLFDVPGTSIALQDTLRRWDSGPWRKRGWTYQEDIFARRRLVIGEDVAEWQCACFHWREDQPLPTDLGKPLEFPTNIEVVELRNQRALFEYDGPDLYAYLSLVQAYTKTELTFPEDIQNAFAGITTKLSRTFVGGFSYGLPEMYLDIALLWAPNPSELCPRRQSAEVQTVMPSWSWMGWSCRVDTVWTIWYTQNMGLSPLHRLILYPLVQWYSFSAEGKRKINNCWHTYRDATEDKLPENWTYHERSHETEAPYFTHAHIVDQEFEFPIPLSHCAREENLERGPLLSCQTQRTFFHLRCADVSTDEDGELYDNGGLTIGYLRCHADAGNKHPAGARSPDIREARTNIEVVAISEISAISLVVNELFRRDSIDTYEEDKTDYYNALWIEWTGGIAYRKGVGIVSKVAWKASQPEWIDLILG